MVRTRRPILPAPSCAAACPSTTTRICLRAVLPTTQTAVCGPHRDKMLDRIIGQTSPTAFLCLRSLGHPIDADVRCPPSEDVRVRSGKVPPFHGLHLF